MPSYFKKIENSEVETTPFDRFHLSEVTGERVKTKQEMPDNVVELTTEQAYELIDKWNDTTHMYAASVDVKYSL